MDSKNKAMICLRDNLYFIRSCILKVSQSDLSKMCGVSRDVLWRIENYSEYCKGRDASLKTICMLSDFFGISVAELIEGSVRDDEKLRSKVVGGLYGNSSKSDTKTAGKRG